MCAILVAGLVACGASGTPVPEKPAEWTAFTEWKLVRDMAFDADGNLWMADYGAVVRLDPDTAEYKVHH